MDIPTTTVWEYRVCIKERNPFPNCFGFIIITNLETNNTYTVKVIGKHYKLNRNTLIQLNEEMKMNKTDFDKKHITMDKIMVPSNDSITREA